MQPIGSPTLFWQRLYCGASATAVIEPSPPTSRVGPLAERLLEGPEPGLEVTQLLDPILINGLTHPLAARPAHAPLGLVELETRHLEVEPDELQSPAHLRLEVFDQLLVLHTQYLARIGQAAPGRHLLPTGFSRRLAS